MSFELFFMKGFMSFHSNKKSRSETALNGKPLPIIKYGRMSDLG